MKEGKEEKHDNGWRGRRRRGQQGECQKEVQIFPKLTLRVRENAGQFSKLDFCKHGEKGFVTSDNTEELEIREEQKKENDRTYQPNRDVTIHQIDVHE